MSGLIPTSGIWSLTSESDHLQPHIHIALGGVGVGADHMRLLHQALRARAVETGHADRKLNIDAEALAVIARADADGGGDRGAVGDLQLLLPSDVFHRAEEAGGIAAGEQLLRIGALAAGWIALAAELLRRHQVEIEDAVRRLGMAGAAAGRCRLRGVEN